MPRFELGTSSLPRRHTTGLCHIGNAHQGINPGTHPVQERMRGDHLQHCASIMWGFIGLKDCGKFLKKPDLHPISCLDEPFYRG
jgi:hypothetical protein